MAEMSRLPRIDRDVLTPIVARALDCPDVTVTGWEHHVVKGDWSPDTRLVCRIHGRAKRGREEVCWSVFLKVPNPTAAHFAPWHREPFHREPRLFECGVLNDLPGGLAAPRCLGVTRFPDDQPWMWLEDVDAQPSLEWPVGRFALAGHHLGAMQGAFLAGRPLPPEPWLDTSGWLPEKLAAGAARVPKILESLANHPLTRRLYDSELADPLGRVWAEREAIFAALERMPKSLCHHDFCYGNLLARSLPDGSDQTVVLDWQYAGYGQIGSDIAGLIADSSVCPVRRKAAEPEELTELIVGGYLSGLRDAGWDADPGIPRFACLATLAWPWTFNLLLGLYGGVLMRAPSEGNPDRQEQKVDEYRRRQEFLFEQADIARSLLKVVRAR